VRVTLTDDSLRIDLGFWERIYAVHYPAEVRLDHIESVTVEPAKHGWWFIKVGEPFSWSRKKEFWFARRGKDLLVINCRAGRYVKVVLSLDDNEHWASKIQAAIQR
jgi:hypothetical protein